MIYTRTGDDPAALEMYLKCLEHDGDNLAALLGLFQTSCRMGSFARIIHYLQLYLAGHPDDASVLFCLAALHAREGRLALAERDLRRVLSMEPDKKEAAELLCQGPPGGSGGMALDGHSPGKLGTALAGRRFASRCGKW